MDLSQFVIHLGDKVPIAIVVWIQWAAYICEDATKHSVYVHFCCFTDFGSCLFASDAGFAGCVESAPLSNRYASDHISISHLGDHICIEVTQAAVPGHQVSSGSGGLGS